MSKERVSKFLERTLKKTEGVSCVELTHRKKHPILKWQFGGGGYKYVCPFSASDARSRKNCLAEVRRLMRQGVHHQGAGFSRSTS
jgi:hypothetical protein